MDFRDLKENAAEAVRVAATLFLLYGLVALACLVFGTGLRAADLAMLGLIAVPVFGGALIVLVGLLAAYLACLPFRVLHRIASTRRAKPLRKKGVGDPDFDL